MNKAIAHILKEQLAGLPLFEKLAGLVQVAEYQETVYDETGAVPTTLVQRIPVSCDTPGGKDLVPDEKKGGILYFEDGGVAAFGKAGPNWKWKSRLRLVAWYNTANVGSLACTAIQPVLVNHIVTKLDGLNNDSIAPFTKLQVTVEGMPKADKALFSAYTYDLLNTGYLMAPYDYFALDLSVDFQIHPKCVTQLT